MNYKTLVRQSTNKGYMKKVAGDLKKNMHNQRQGANPSDERRWIWELIQNGKDVAVPGVPFHISINLSSETAPAVLEFRHNGKPFSVENITYLVEAVSSKDQEEQEEQEDELRPTGKFGSGFLTTHLLSEKVELETVIKAENLPYKKCKLELDRSPFDIDGFMKSMQSSLSMLETLDDLEDLSHYTPNEFSTVFRYQLDERGIKIAQTGLHDLHQSVIFTLVFVPVIKSITIENHGITYQLLDELTEEKNDITFYTIETRSAIGSPLKQTIISVKGERTQIAMPAETNNENIFLKKLDETQPRLFCDFPMIGSEDFPFPVIANSPYYDLNDPRSTIILSDVKEAGIDENKALIKEAVSLYTKLLKYCDGNKKVQHVFNIAGMSATIKKTWLSEKWYKSEMLDPVHNALSSMALIDLENGDRVSVDNGEKTANVAFPAHVNNDVRESLYDVGNDLFPHAMPRKAEIDEWFKVLWSRCYKLTVKALSNIIAEAKNITTLTEKLNGRCDTIKWLNKYYALLNQEELFIADVVSNTIAVLPDQNGDFKLMKDLKLDSGIEEIFKDVLKSLNYDIRKELRTRELITINKFKDDPKHQIVHSNYKRENIYNTINNLLKEISEQKAFSTASKIIGIITLEGNAPAWHQKLFESMQRLFPEQVFERAEVKEYSDKIYEQANRVVIQNMIMKISSYGNLTTFSSKQDFGDQESARKWLADFVLLLQDMAQDQYLHITESPILPNQHGRFCPREKLFGGSDTDETLKDVAAKLGYDYRKTLIDPTMPISFDEVMTVNNSTIAEKISTLAGTLMADMRQDEEVQTGFRKLFAWFNENKKLAASLFGDLFINRHRLCEPDQIVTSMEKAADLDALLRENDVETVDALRNILQNSVQRPKEPNISQVTQEILVNLGVKDYDEFKEALKDKNLAELFSHTSVPSTEYFIFAQGLIERTKEQVKSFLIKLGYDFSNAVNSATTVFTGVLKEENLIDIVYRPGDNNVVILYYGSETATLKNPGAELWVCKAIGDPVLLTLGKVIEDNDLKKISFI